MVVKSRIGAIPWVFNPRLDGACWSAGVLFLAMVGHHRGLDRNCGSSDSQFSATRSPPDARLGDDWTGVRVPNTSLLVACGTHKNA